MNIIQHLYNKKPQNFQAHTKYTTTRWELSIQERVDSISWGFSFWCGLVVADLVINLFLTLQRVNVFTARMNHYHTFYSSSNKGTVLLNYLICVSRMPLRLWSNSPGTCSSLENRRYHSNVHVLILWNHFQNSQLQPPQGILDFFFFKSINSYLGNLITSQTARCVIGASIISTSVVCPVWQWIQL